MLHTTNFGDMLRFIGSESQHNNFYFFGFKDIFHHSLKYEPL